MNQKKRGISWSFLFLIILLAGFVSADSCWITTRASCSDTVVMGLSALTNAHGELFNQNNYNYVLCCDFIDATTTCDGTNRVLKLSDVTNAHAQIPDIVGIAEAIIYDYDVCYSNLECASNSGSCQTGYEIPMLSLSSNSNAHIGEFDNYSIKICCTTGEPVCVPDCTGRECGMDPVCGTLNCGTCVSPETCDVNGLCISQEPYAYWASANNPTTAITEINVIPGTTQVSLVLRNTGLSNGTEVNFEIIEDDLLTGDEEIRVGANAIKGFVNNQGDAIEKWTITQEDLNKALGIFGLGDLDNFVFMVNEQFSNDLSITISDETCVGINYCVNYLEQDTCEEDICIVADDSVNLNNPEITCGDGYICECWWNSSETEGKKCAPKWTGIQTSPYCGDGNIDAGEQCDGSNLGNFNSDDCDLFNSCTGGTLSCGNDCLFNLAECTECTTGGTCGDNIIQVPNSNGFYEQCDGNNAGFTCSDFDSFDDSGSLSCYAPGTQNECMLDTSSCTTGGSSDTPGLGTCKWDYTNTDYDCTDGYMIYSATSYIDWPADNPGWSNPNLCIAAGGTSTTCVRFNRTDEINDDNLWHYDDILYTTSENRLFTQCYSKSDTLDCPTQIQLSFFGFYNLIIAFILITLIYVVLIERKKH